MGGVLTVLLMLHFVGENTDGRCFRDAGGRERRLLENGRLKCAETMKDGMGIEDCRGGWSRVYRRQDKGRGEVGREGVSGGGGGKHSRRIRCMENVVYGSDGIKEFHVHAAPQKAKTRVVLGRITGK